MYVLKNKITSIAITTGMLFSISACSKKTEPIEELKPRPVITYQVPDLKTNSVRRFSGQTEAFNSVNLGFEVSGRIIMLKAKRGERYKKGEIIAQLDPARLLTDLENAKAQALQAVQELRRTQELLESKNASQSDFDAAIANQKATEERQNASELAVKNATLKMPYDGIIADVPANVNQVVAVGTAVVAVQGSVGMEFKAGVPAGLVSLIKPGQPVQISLGAIPGQTIKGVAALVSPTASANTTYQVTITIPDPEKITYLRAGMDGEAIFDFPITSDSKSAGFSIPSSCIISDPSGTNFVWVIKSPAALESIVTKAEVTIGELAKGGHINVISGIKQGQVIVSRGAHRLSANTIVSLEK